MDSMTENFQVVLGRTGFDPHDPEIDAMMRERALAQGREHGAPRITNDPQALDPEFEGEIRYLEPLADRSAYSIPGPHGSCNCSFCTFALYQTQFFKAYFWRVKAFEEAMRRVAAVLAITAEEAAESIRRLGAALPVKDPDMLADLVIQTGRDPGSNIVIDASGGVWVVSTGTWSRQEQIPAPTLAEKRHGYAAECPRHGATVGGLCRSCARRSRRSAGSPGWGGKARRRSRRRMR